MKPSGYQACLFAADAKPELSFENGFRFFDGIFDGVPSYRGKYRFSKHYLGWDRVAAFDGKGEGGEEYECARAIDSLSEVEYWVRNVSQHPNAFWLPVAGGKTYPDFFALLKDGRLLVVEYKGDQLLAASLEKRTIGELWQRASAGNGAYVMAQASLDSMDVRAQLRAALEYTVFGSDVAFQ